MEKGKFFNNLLESETFGEGRRHYFVDLRLATNHTLYLEITRSDRKGADDKTPHYERVSVRIFEEEIGMLIGAMSMILERYNAHQY
jgi:DNA repair protein RadC